MGHGARDARLLEGAVVVPVRIVEVAASGRRDGDGGAVRGTRVVGLPGGDEGGCLGKHAARHQKQHEAKHVLEKFGEIARKQAMVERVMLPCSKAERSDFHFFELEIVKKSAGAIWMLHLVPRPAKVWPAPSEGLSLFGQRVGLFLQSGKNKKIKTLTINYLRIFLRRSPNSFEKIRVKQGGSLKPVRQAISALGLSAFCTMET